MQRHDHKLARLGWATMETSFFLDSKAKRLNLAFKKKYVHNSDAVLTIKGRLDTTNAAAVVNTSLEKVRKSKVCWEFNEHS